VKAKKRRKRLKHDGALRAQKKVKNAKRCKNHHKDTNKNSSILYPHERSEYNPFLIFNPFHLAY
jgi:hypothetical protein